MDFETYSLTSKEVVKKEVVKDTVKPIKVKYALPDFKAPEYKDRVIQAIKDTAEGRLMETLLEFAEMMDYKEAFCSPILEMDSAFFSSMDEVDHYQQSLQKKQIELLKDILEELRKR